MHTILLVRMSSLGDIVHTFPVLTDIRRERPQSKIHWAVEEAYVSLAALHPAVDRIIPIALRPWRRQLFARGLDVGTPVLSESQGKLLIIQ